MVDDLPRDSNVDVLTVGLEDYFHVGTFNRIVQQGQWYRFETRLERNTRRVLDLLDERGSKATFFVLGWVADTVPEVVREVLHRGHEVANRGYYHRSVREMTPNEFRDDLLRSQEAIQRATGAPVYGYRVAHQWFTRSDLWALDVLADEGYRYDSSILPALRGQRSEPWRRVVHRHRTAKKEIWEFPLSTWDVLGCSVPIAGGNYLRQFPPALMRYAVSRWHRRHREPFVMYFHVWELDPEQPRIHAASWLSRVRHYRNLGTMAGRLRHYLTKYRFTSIADYLNLPTAPIVSVAPARSSERILVPSGAHGALSQGTHCLEPDRRTPVTVVVPCYNEELTIPYVSNTLKSVRVALESDYQLHFVFVDDASSDGTWRSLQNTFRDWPDCRLVQHTENQGVAAAVQTGIAHAETETVCSIDCDCSYDPHHLSGMIPLLGPGVDLVTASPYHPEGAVRNVPSWRLFLSKGVSWLYRRVLHHKLSTYTSCFRVYRRSAVLGLALRERGFLGVAELLGRLDLTGGRIVEYPTTLEVRVLGYSKMKVLSTIVGHVRLLGRLLWLRLSGGHTRLRSEPAVGQPAGKTSR